MQDKATHPQLKTSFQTHLAETHTQAKKLEELFRAIDEKPAGHMCKAMKGIIDEAKDLSKYDAPASVRMLH